MRIEEDTHLRISKVIDNVTETIAFSSVETNSTGIPDNLTDEEILELINRLEQLSLE